MIKVKWIKVGDVIEVDGKKAKLISVVEDLTYADLYTFKKEDDSKFHWRHNEVYRYAMDRHIGKLEGLLCEQKQRADEVEEKWEKLKKWLDEGVINQSSKYDKTGVPAFKHFRKVLESTQEKMNKLERGEDE